MLRVCSHSVRIHSRFQSLLSLLAGGSLLTRISCEGTHRSSPAKRNRRLWEREWFEIVPRKRRDLQSREDLGSTGRLKHSFLPKFVGRSSNCKSCHQFSNAKFNHPHRSPQSEVKRFISILFTDKATEENS